MTDLELKEKISKMTLEQKLLELTQCNYHDLADPALDKVVTGANSDNVLDKDEYLRVGTILNTSTGQDCVTARKLRKESGIDEPLVIMQDVIHGYRTLYPIPLALACSFNIPLHEQCAEMAAIEAKYDGIDATFSPMVDLVRDARWGRVMESAGEDPYLCGQIGKAYIRGYHKGGIACCVKHFAAYGAAESGMDYNTTEVSEHSLDEYYLRGYQACIEEKPEMVMTSFNALNGKPILGCKDIVVNKLRNQWGFDGVLISDHSAVEEMINHGYCQDLKECAKVAIDAKLDIEMCTPAYVKCLPELLQEGRVTMQQINEGVLRVLQLKNKLGLYENPTRFTDLDKYEHIKLSDDFRVLARKAAEESAVLLKNNNVLPLKQSAKILLCGPFANEKEIFGGWHCRGRKEDTVSVLEGIQSLLGKTVECEHGCTCGLFDNNFADIDNVVQSAKNADTIVACIGENMWNSGEANSRVNISLPQVQVRLVQELSKLGKPIVLVVFGGRPLVLTDVEQYADAILYAWQPGTEGGNAIANLLFGKAVPSAKTTMSFPLSVGQCPIYYNHFSTGRPKPTDNGPIDWYYAGYIDSKNAPLYPFGYGLSYTTFAYSDFKLEKAVLSRGEKTVASVTVTNNGDYDAQDVVQWYIRDRFASCVRPVKELKGFEKVFLKAGEKTTVRFVIDENVLAFYTASGTFEAENGVFDIFVGGNSRDTLSLELRLQ